jgi:hypothetical protein
LALKPHRQSGNLEVRRPGEGSNVEMRQESEIYLHNTSIPASKGVEAAKGRQSDSSPVEAGRAVAADGSKALATVPGEAPLERIDPQIREHLLQRFSEAQLALLLQKTPRREVRTRLLNPNRPEGPGNPRLRYVEHAYVTETLNLLFGFNWDLEVLEQQRIENEAVIKARVRIRLPDGTAIAKDSFGGAWYQPGNPNSSWADTFKAAESDALKTAAARLGIGLDLYRHEEQVQRAEPARPKEPDPVANDRLRWNWFWGVKVKELGLTRDEVHKRLGVTSVNDWVSQGKTLDDALKALGGSGGPAQEGSRR